MRRWKTSEDRKQGHEGCRALEPSSALSCSWDRIP